MTSPIYNSHIQLELYIKIWVWLLLYQSLTSLHMSESTLSLAQSSSAACRQITFTDHPLLLNYETFWHKSHEIIKEKWGKKSGLYRWLNTLISLSNILMRQWLKKDSFKAPSFLWECRPEVLKLFGLRVKIWVGRGPQKYWLSVIVTPDNFSALH